MLLFQLMDALIARSSSNQYLIRLWAQRWLDKPENSGLGMGSFSHSGFFITRVRTGLSNRYDVRLKTSAKGAD